jgi:hypothetical protein
MTPDQALKILSNVADAHAMNGPDRRTVEKAIETLAALIPPAKPAAP